MKCVIRWDDDNLYKLRYISSNEILVFSDNFRVFIIKIYVDILIWPYFPSPMLYHGPITPKVYTNTRRELEIKFKYQIEPYHSKIIVLSLKFCGVPL